MFRAFLVSQSLFVSAMLWSQTFVLTQSPTPKALIVALTLIVAIICGFPKAALAHACGIRL